RNFEEEVAPEENARAETDDGVVEARQIFRHRELRDGDVGAVDVSDAVAREEQRQQAPVSFLAGAIECVGGSDHEAASNSPRPASSDFSAENFNSARARSGAPTEWRMSPARGV